MGREQFTCPCNEIGSAQTGSPAPALQPVIIQSSGRIAKGQPGRLAHGPKNQGPIDPQSNRLPTGPSAVSPCELCPGSGIPIWCKIVGGGSHCGRPFSGRFRDVLAVR